MVLNTISILPVLKEVLIDEAFLLNSKIQLPTWHLQHLGGGLNYKIAKWNFLFPDKPIILFSNSTIHPEDKARNPEIIFESFLLAPTSNP